VPLLGLYGTWRGWRSAEDAKTKRDWTTVAVLLGGAFLLSLFVRRAESVAQLYALGGCASLLLAVLPHVRRVRWVALRAPLTAAVIALPLPAPAMIRTAVDEVRLQEAASRPSGAAPAANLTLCDTRDNLAGLARLRPSRLLAPVDLGSALLAYTPHATMSGGYHRSNLAMRGVISTFLGSSGEALAYVRAHRVDLVVMCRHIGETDRYLRLSPNGFMAQLEAGQAPPWLDPVPLPGKPNLQVWRVNLSSPH
jgi:hypothetical protein